MPLVVDFRLLIVSWKFCLLVPSMISSSFVWPSLTHVLELAEVVGHLLPQQQRRATDGNRASNLENLAKCTRNPAEQG